MKLTKPYAACVRNLGARARKTYPGLHFLSLVPRPIRKIGPGYEAITPWAVRATEEVEKGNVMYIVGQTQVKGYSFTWSIEWTEFMNCYISLIGTLSSQPKTMAQAWMRLNCNWGDSSSIFVLFFPFFFLTCSGVVVFYINILQTTVDM